MMIKSKTLKLRRHPELSWPRPFIFEELPLSGFVPLRRVAFLGRQGSDFLFGEGPLHFRIRICKSGTLRFSFAPDGQFPSDTLSATQAVGYGILRYTWSGATCRLDVGKKSVTIRTDRLTVKVGLEPFTLSIRDNKGKSLLDADPEAFAFKGAGPEGQTLSMFNHIANEQFFGFGGRTHRPNRTGSTADLFSIKVETLRGDYGGFPIPYFLSTGGYGFLLDNPWPHVYFDMGREFPDRWFLHTPGGNLDFYVLAGPTFADITKRYCQLTGFPALPPQWMLGFWLSWAEPVMNADEVIATANRMTTEGWPLDVVVLDMYWRESALGLRKPDDPPITHGMDWASSRFGDGIKVIDALKAQQIRLCLHLNTKMYNGAEAEAGLAAGHLRRPEPSDIVPNLPGRDAEDWYWETHRPRVEEGAAAWWTDNGERVDGKLSCGLPSRNLFGHFWNQLLYERMAAMGRDGRLVLSRGGWLGSQRHTLTWPGDTGPGIDRHREDIWWHLNCSVSGIPYNTVDTGGFFLHWDAAVPLPDQSSVPADQRAPSVYGRMVHDRDNVVRRVVNGLMLFTVPRVHGPLKLPWMYSQDIQELWRFFIRLRYRVFPYLYSYILHGVRSGEPPYRPLVWSNPDDLDAAHVDDQLYCGDDIIMAPVMEENGQDREVYLPKGVWFNFWTQERIEGPRRIVANAPMMQPEGLPMFVRQGAVIPMRPDCTRNGDACEPELILHLWPEKRGKRVFHDSLDYQWRVRHHITNHVLTITIDNPLPRERRIHVVLHGQAGGRQLAPAVTWPFDNRRGLSLTIPAGGSAERNIPLPRPKR